MEVKEQIVAAPNESTIKSGLKQLIVERLSLDIEPSSIDDEAPLFGGEDGEEVESVVTLDSVEALELVVGIEERWGVVIEDDSVASEFYSIQTLSTLVVRLIGEGSQEAASA